MTSYRYERFVSTYIMRALRAPHHLQVSPGLLQT